MQLLTEFLPILIFFYIFKSKGLMVATFVAMLISLLQLIIAKFIIGKYKTMQLASFFSLLILGGITLICKKDIFIKWKPTAIYWILAILFFVTPLIKRSTLVEKFIVNIKLPKKVWNLLNNLWIIFFIFMGCLNLYIVYHFDTNTWVNFKLFGTLGLTIIFGALQAFLIYKYSTKI